MFHLEAEIQRWRERTAAALSLRADVVDELEAHLRDDIEQQLAAGTEPALAFRRAEERLGPPDELAQEFHKLFPTPKIPWTQRTMSLLRLTTFEFRLTLRRLFRRRAQNLLLLGTFAVSIILACVSWSLFHTTFLGQPDFDPEGRIYVLAYQGDAPAGALSLSLAEVEAFERGCDALSDFSPVCLYYSSFVHTPRGAERLFAAGISSRAMNLVHARPLLGRPFVAEEDIHGSARRVILSERLWENSFGRDPRIVGRPFVFASGGTATIVGVMPRTFRFPNDQDFWFSYGSAFDNPKYPIRQVLVTLKPGVTVAQAEIQLNAVLARFPAESPVRKLSLRAALVPFQDYYLNASSQVSARVLFALSLVFVLVSCANAANLMLLDFLGRRAEVAATLALGIPRSAAIRSLCFQVGTIALGAAVLSLAILPFAGPLLYERTRVINTPYWLTYHFTASDAWMAVGLAALSALVTVIAPIAYLLWADSDRVIREHSSASRGAGRAAWRRSLLLAQIALLTVLGVSAGVLLHTSYEMGARRWGYPAESIFMGKISVAALTTNGGDDAAVCRTGELKALREIEARPDTVAAALADESPGYSHKPNCAYATDPGNLSDLGSANRAFFSSVTENFFLALDVPFVAGETFSQVIPDEGPLPAVINESLAARLWPGKDPLGRTLFIRVGVKRDSDAPQPVVIRGVVRDFQASGPFGLTNDCLFVPFRPKEGMGNSLFVYVRDRVGLPSERSITDAVHRSDPRASLYFPSTVAAQINLTLSPLNTSRDLTTVFLIAAALLCAVGIYSLTVTQVMQSTREFGIRMALGGEAWRLWRRFTRSHLAIVLAGIGAGLLISIYVVRAAGSLLYGVSPFHAGVLGSVAGGILLIAALACLPSLGRLKRINPADCLRSL